MKNLLRIEEIVIFALAIYFFNQTSFVWWWFPALLLTPDIGMVGYLINNKTGAFTYNLFHHKGIAIFILITGWYCNLEWTVLTGIILLAHSALDRVFGYGLKYTDSFQNTHLGNIANTKT